MINNNEFIPDSTEKKQLVIDLNKKLYSRKSFPTRIYYQYGVISGQKAVRLYIDDELIATRKCKSYQNEEDAAFAALLLRFSHLEDCGVQSLNSARSQREKTLKAIVQEIFNSIGYKEIQNPLYGYRPDLVFENDNHTLILELKAFYKDTIVAEPQIGQIAKYGLASTELEVKNKIRLLLITTGKLIQIPDAIFFQNDDPDVKEFAEKRYGSLIKGIINPTYLDEWERLWMYRKFLNNFWKKITFPRWSDENWKQIRFKIKQILNMEEFNKFIQMKEKILIGFISEIGLKQILKHLNKSKMIDKLLKLVNTRLENLIINKDILA